MAQQKFSNSFREALWETYGQKCFHCSRELLFSELRVDHIVPEHLHHGEAAKREEVLAEIGLPADFNILSRANLAPTCERCNGQKSGALLVGRSIAVALTRIAGNLGKLEANIGRRRRDRDLEDILLTINRSLRGGKFTPEQFVAEFARVVGPTIGLKSDQIDEIAEESGKYKNWKYCARVLESKARQLDYSLAEVFEAIENGEITGAPRDPREFGLYDNFYTVKGLSLKMGCGDDEITFVVGADSVTLYNVHLGYLYHSGY